MIRDDFFFKQAFPLSILFYQFSNEAKKLPLLKTLSFTIIFSQNYSGVL